MKKIVEIKVQNLKAVEEAEIRLKGASIIMTASNDSGKSTVLKSLIDRFRGQKPSLIVKEGEKNGFYFMNLNDGSSFEWNFTNKSEKITYITSDGLRMTDGVLSSLGEKYFGKEFDVNKFINSSPKKQQKELEKIVGLDFSKLDQNYKQNFDERTEVNRELKYLRSLNKKVPIEVFEINLNELEKIRSDIEQKNEKLNSIWKFDNSEKLKINNETNKNIRKQKNIYETAQKEFETATNFEILKEFIDLVNIAEFIDVLSEKNINEIIFEPLPEPAYISTKEISEQIRLAYENNVNFVNYKKDLQSYNSWKEKGKKIARKSEELTKELDKILKEKQELIKTAKIPKEFKITDKGLLYNGYPLESNQISTSSKYIAGLKLGALLLGEIKTLHFDASTLDNQNLSKIIKWADSENLQLLIERPKFEGGKIEYKVVSEL